MTFNSVYGILYLIGGKWYLLGPEPTEEMLANPDAWAESEFDNSDDNWPVWPTDGERVEGTRCDGAEWWDESHQNTVKEFLSE